MDVVKEMNDEEEERFVHMTAEQTMGLGFMSVS